MGLKSGKGCDLSELSAKDLQSIDDRINSDVTDYLSIRDSMNARNSQGGTATSKTAEQIEYLKNWIQSIK